MGRFHDGDFMTASEFCDWSICGLCVLDDAFKKQQFPVLTRINEYICQDQSSAVDASSNVWFFSWDRFVAAVAALKGEAFFVLCDDGY